MPSIKQADTKASKPSFNLAELFQRVIFKKTSAKGSLLPSNASKIFVGRTEELNFFVENILKPETPSHNIISVYGQKGIGKSELLRQFIEKTQLPAFKDYCLSALVDQRQLPVDTILEQFADHLHIEGVFKKTLDNYKGILHKRQAPGEATRQAARHIVPEVAGAISPVIGGPLGVLGSFFAKSTGTGGTNRFVSAIHARQHLKDAEQLEELVGDLTRAFVAELNRLTAAQAKRTKRQHRVILLFDAYEKQDGMIASWLLDYFLPIEVSNNVVLVVARGAPIDRSTPEEPNDWSLYQSMIYPMELEPLTESETRTYLRNRKITNLDRVARIWQASRGIPLSLASYANQHGEVDPTATYVENLLREISAEEQNEERRQVKQQLSLDGALFSKPFTRDDLEAFWNLPEEYAFLPKDNRQRNRLFNWLAKQTFVTRNLQGQYTYNSDVQEQFSRYLFQLSEKDSYVTRTALAGYYQRLLEKISVERGDGVYNSAEWRDLVSALAYQLFLLPDEASNVKAIEQVLSAYHEAEQPEAIVVMLLKLAQDLPEDQISPLSRQSVGHILRYIQADLGSQEYVAAASFLLERAANKPSFSPQVLVHLYRNRGISYILLNKFQQALADLNHASTLSPGGALIYANRGLVYLAIGESQQAIKKLSQAVESGLEMDWIFTSRGLAYLTAGDTLQALADLNRALELDSRDALVYANRGLVYLSLKDFQQALADLNRTLELNPDEAWASSIRGLIYLTFQEPQKALEDCNHALELEPNLIQAYTGRGFAYALLNERDRAIADLDQAIELTPNSALAYASRGFAYSLLQEPQKALEDCNHALELTPNLIQAYTGRGFANMALNEPQRASDDFGYVLEQAPELTWARTGRGFAALALNDSQRAITDFNDAIELAPKLARAYSGRGQAYAALGELQRAIDDCNHALELDPKDVWAYASRGLASALLNEPQKALEDCNHALKLAPNLAVAYVGRGLASAALSEPQKAIEDCKHGLKIAPHLALAYFGLGLTYLDLGESPQAIENFDRLIELAPNLAQAYSGRGLAYLALKEYSQALENFDRVIELAPKLAPKLAPDIAQAYAGRGFAALALNDSQRAIEDYTRAIELDPNAASIYEKRGLVYANLKEYQRAIEDYTRAIELDPNAASIYEKRGLAYVNLKEYQRAIEDYTRAIAPAVPASRPPALETTLADLGSMLPAEDLVARFLNDVADIAVPPTREREGTAVTSFVLPSATSLEEAERKKARTEPFWSQVVATPMEQRASIPPSTRSRRPRRNRGHELRWLALIAAILIPVVIGLAVVVYTHPGLLHPK